MLGVDRGRAGARRKNLDTVSGESTLDVVRGPNGDHQDVWAREHEAGAPVTFTHLDDVFIHAKIVLIDDVYASIGSANMNRRSMFHDGELNTMVVPGGCAPQLTIRCVRSAAGSGRPSRAATPRRRGGALRSARRAALPARRARRKPAHAAQLLDNTEPEGFEVPLTDPDAIDVLKTIFGGLGQVSGDVAKAALWRTLIDPTTSLDPFFDTQPFDL